MHVQSIISLFVHRLVGQNQVSFFEFFKIVDRPPSGIILIFLLWGNFVWKYTEKYMDR